MRWSWTVGMLAPTLVLLTTLAAAEPQEKETASPIPETGKTAVEFDGFDQVMSAIIKRHHLPGAALAVAKGGKIIYARGFGYADLDKKEQVEPAALFRIASISKPITAVAILQLVEHNKLKLDEHVFEVLELKEPEGANVKFDERWKRITILHLLQHMGGWNRERSFDPMFRSPMIVKELGIAAPATPDSIVQYMLRRPLDFNPGSDFAYSNFGYSLLGRVIEKRSGQDYETYVRKEVLAPLGITTMKIGKSLPAERATGEVKYYATGKGAAVLGPNLGELVPLPYGSWSQEALDSHGGWIASAEDLVKFGMAFNQPAKCKILSEKSIKDMFARPEGAPMRTLPNKPTGAYYACGWYVRPVGERGQLNTWHTGALPGTSALLVRRCDCMTWAVLFNSREGENGVKPADEIDPLLHEAADAYLKATK